MPVLILSGWTDAPVTNPYAAITYPGIAPPSPCATLLTKDVSEAMAASASLPVLYCTYVVMSACMLVLTGTIHPPATPPIRALIYIKIIDVTSSSRSRLSAVDIMTAVR